MAAVIDLDSTGAIALVSLRFRSRLVDVQSVLIET
jgi:hypothetical protein